jgi:putative transposase
VWRLKQLVAERDLEIEVMKEIAAKKMVSVLVCRVQVAYAVSRCLSQRRSCTLLKVARSALGYRSVEAAKGAPVPAHMAALGAQYPCFGTGAFVSSWTARATL